MKTHAHYLKNLGALAAVLTMAISFSSAPAFAFPQDAAPGITDAEIVAAQQFGQSLSIAEWLGPMAPVALSPFFGVACLSGLSLFGGDWVAQSNPLIGPNSPLHDNRVFFIFLILTLLTSIPRLTKVSKPFAQAADHLESWSGIITMLVLRYMVSSETMAENAPVAVVQSGLISFSADFVLMLAAAVNIFVISTVRFFCEVLVWLTPVPVLDAVFELSNKVICATLAALYAWSPLLALSLNAAIFFGALLVFGWVHRREIFFRILLFDLLRAWMSSPNPELASSLTVFPVRCVGAISARARCQLHAVEGGWMLTYHRWFGRSVEVLLSEHSRPRLKAGVFSSTITCTDPVIELTTSRLYSASMPGLASKFRLELSQNEGHVGTPNFRTEFA